MKAPIKNVVVTGRGFIWEYDFDKGETRSISGRQVRKEHHRDIEFRVFADIVQTDSTKTAEELLAAIKSGEHYEKIIDYGRGNGIEKIYEANVPSPFL